MEDDKCANCNGDFYNVDDEPLKLYVMGMHIYVCSPECNQYVLQERLINRTVLQKEVV